VIFIALALLWGCSHRAAHEHGATAAADTLSNGLPRAHVEVISPDSARSLDFDTYLDFDRGQDGGIHGMREPDSRAVLTDFRADSAWVVDFCGTPCDHDGAYWVDADRFVLTGSTQTGERLDGPRCAYLDVYDFVAGCRSRWQTRIVDEAHFYWWSQALDSALAARVERAGFGGGADSSATSRGFSTR